LVEGVEMVVEAWHHTRELRQWTLVPPAAAALTGSSKRAINRDGTMPAVVSGYARTADTSTPWHA
jgi:hypothetical protein